MRTYASHRPTVFDSHISIDGREDWYLVGGVSRNRDSGPMAESNFHSALEMLGGESDDVEVHRFGHWGPGWYEIIIVRPDTEAARIAEEIEKKLEDYPLLDEDDLSEREHELEGECWDSYGWRDMRDMLCKAYPHATDRWHSLDGEVLWEAYREAGEACGIDPEMSDEGANFRLKQLFEECDMKSFVLSALMKRRRR